MITYIKVIKVALESLFGFINKQKYCLFEIMSNFTTFLYYKTDLIMVLLW